MRRILFASAALALVLAQVAQGQQDEEIPKGHLVVVGGGGMPGAVYERTIRLAGDNPRVVIFPQASEKSTGQGSRERWVKAGAREALVVKDLSDAVGAVREADLIWFGGGQQSRLMRALEGTGVPEEIHRRYRNGAVVGGTSAGAAVMSKVMISGGNPDGPPLRGEGLGLWPGVIVDQHFRQRKRMGRLEHIVRANPKLLGLGIDESTAAIVSGGVFEVVGAGVVTIYNARGRDLQTQQLENGARFSVAKGVTLGGKTSFDFEFSDKRIKVWTYVPEGAGPQSQIVFVMHGVRRNGEDYRKPWIPLADQYGCMVFVPEFSTSEWPGSRSYNLGNVMDAESELLSEEEWAFSAIDALFNHIRASHGNSSARYQIFGHSAGAQFVHRMALLRPAAKYDIAVAANAGWYTLPNLDQPYPTGLGQTPTTVESIKQVLGRRLVVLLGEKDSDPTHKHLPRGKSAQVQGPHRLARGKFFFEAAAKAAEEVGVDLSWELTTVPHANHNNVQMAPAAAERMFATPRVGDRGATR